jgi:hypothetical protein
MVVREDRRRDLAHLMMGVGLLLLGIAALCLVLWLSVSKQDSKLYEVDNVVCVSQPLAINCFERKPR